MAASESVGPPTLMRAWQYSKFGGGADALVLNTQVPVPKPRSGEVLVRVQASSVNPVDWKLQSGILRPFLPPALPCTPGFDIAGEVVEVGPDAGNLGKGEQVFGMTDIRRGGGFAEFAILQARVAARRPPNVPPAQAACLGVAGLTALQSLRDWGKIPLGPKVEGYADGKKEAEKREPGTVLVANASGGVGLYTVQLAKLAGEHVTATCGARNLDLVKSLGADEAVDYKTLEGAALRSPSGKKYGVLVDGTMSLTWKVVAPVLAPAGKWLHLTPNLGVIANTLINAVSPFARQRLYSVLALPNSADLSTLARLSAEGLLKTQVDAEIPFDKAPDAWRKSSEGHVTGKVVVVV